MDMAGSDRQYRGSNVLSFALAGVTALLVITVSPPHLTPPTTEAIPHRLAPPPPGTKATVDPGHTLFLTFWVRGAPRPAVRGRCKIISTILSNAQNSYKNREALCCAGGRGRGVQLHRAWTMEACKKRKPGPESAACHSDRSEYAIYIGAPGPRPRARRPWRRRSARCPWP